MHKNAGVHVSSSIVRRHLLEDPGNTQKLLEMSF